MNFCCDLELEHTEAITEQDILLHDDVASNKVWKQTDQQFGRKNSHIHSMCPNLDFGDSNLIHFVYGDASPYQGWLQKVQQFRKYHPVEWYFERSV